MNHTTKKRPSETILLAAMIVAAAVIVAFLTFLLPRPDFSSLRDDPAEMTDTAGETLVKPGASLLQTIAYSRCQHSVQRRVAAPEELYGQSLSQTEGFYPDWRITSFSGDEVVMELTAPLFCPDHLVLLPDDTGRVCIFKNLYGDAMSLHKQLDLTLDSLPESYREEITRGVGFSTSEELELWLESAES